MISDTSPDPIIVSNHTPAWLRWGLCLFGLVFVVLAGKDLLRALWPINIFTPFFGLLMGTGVAAGAWLIHGSMFGPDCLWQIEDGRLTVVQTLREKRTVDTYAASDFDTIDVRLIEGDGSPDTWKLSIILHDGASLLSPHFPREEMARAARLRLLS